MVGGFKKIPFPLPSRKRETHVKEIQSLELQLTPTPRADLRYRDTRAARLPVVVENAHRRDGGAAEVRVHRVRQRHSERFG